MTNRRWTFRSRICSTTLQAEVSSATQNTAGVMNSLIGVGSTFSIWNSSHHSRGNGVPYSTSGGEVLEFLAVVDEDVRLGQHANGPARLVDDGRSR